MYKQNDLTHFNQILDNYHVPRLWKEIQDRADYAKRRIEVDEYNKLNKWKKRGLALIPTK